MPSQRRVTRDINANCQLPTADLETPFASFRAMVRRGCLKMSMAYNNCIELKKKVTLDLENGFHKKGNGYAFDGLHPGRHI